MLGRASGFYLASAGQDTRAIQLYLGHKENQHTVRYTKLKPAAVQGFLEGLIMLDIETDFHGWLLDQVAALRARDYESLDCDHLAEESELMGARELRQLRAELKILLLHLLKLKFQPSQLHRHHSWRNSIVERANRSPTSSRIHRASSGVSVTKCSPMSSCARVIK